jgi:putative colanic acid biosynthesis glycosyltransferase WcaE
MDEIVSRAGKEIEPPVTLSVITIVRDDLPGLAASCASLQPILASDVEHIVVDGSTKSDVRNFLSLRRAERVKWISEPDEGIYDAMNKGLALASGSYVLFLNAGDKVHHLFSVTKLRALIARCQMSAAPPVILGYAVEVYGNRHYLRPGLGDEASVFTEPSHQATFFPQHFVDTNRFRRDIPVGADAEFMARAIYHCGAVFLPTIVCEFTLGGISTNYSKLSIVFRRLKENTSPVQRLKLLAKTALWRVLPRERFYDLLASYNNCTRFSDAAALPLLADELHSVQNFRNVGPSVNA